MKKNLLICLILFWSQISFGQSSDEVQIKKVLYQQADAWNQGDIETYMQGYWNSDSLRFVGSSGITYGWKNTLEGYKKRYPGKSAMGELTFGIKVLERAGPDSFFMVGTYLVERASGDLNGYFSLLWKKIDGKWLITVDHSS